MSRPRRRAADRSTGAKRDRLALALRETAGAVPVGERATREEIAARVDALRAEEID